MRINPKAIIWLVISVLPPSFQLSFGYPPAWRDMSVGQRTELNISERTCVGGAWGGLACLVDVDINHHESWQSAVSPSFLMS